MHLGRFSGTMQGRKRARDEDEICGVFKRLQLCNDDSSEYRKINGLLHDCHVLREQRKNTSLGGGASQNNTAVGGGGVRQKRSENNTR